MTQEAKKQMTDLVAAFRQSADDIILDRVDFTDACDRALGEDLAKIIKTSNQLPAEEQKEVRSDVNTSIQYFKLAIVLGMKRAARQAGQTNTFPKPKKSF